MIDDEIALDQRLIKGRHVPKLTDQRRRRLIAVVTVLLMAAFSLKDYTDVTRLITTQVILVDKKSSQSQQVVDIISVGSLLKESFQDAQQRTFGSHSIIRNFFRFTEMTDFDRDCFTELTNDQLAEITKFCGNKKGVSKLSWLFRKYLFEPKKNAGWMCAQKRPIDGLYHVLKQYKGGEIELPQYLFIIDDDTYINMDSLTELLFKQFPIETPNVVTGCLFDFLEKDAMFFPYGGFGSFLSRASIQRLIQPIDCSTKNAQGGIVDPFTRFSCWRIQENLMGEKMYFEDGMSIGDLMHKFSSSQPFADVSNWRAGYCFHSDHALAYFFNVYHIAVPDGELEANSCSDKLRMKYKYTALTDVDEHGRTGECSNERGNCTVNNHICHYIQPDQMDDLFRAKTLTK
jgi:hypothetical protein